MEKYSRAGSINLKATEEEDEADKDELGDAPEEDDDQFEGILDKRSTNVWKEGGQKKDFVINKLIKCFGSLVIRVETAESFPNNGSFERVYQKAPNASINVLRARVLLKENENYDTKDFTIFISKRKWVKSELRPLLELCASGNDIASSDRDLAMRCCRLVLVLIKRMRAGALKALSTDIKQKALKESKLEAQERLEKETESKANAVEQLAAMLSFKDALCSEKCVKAVTMIFAEALNNERIATRESTKEDLATCISYLRRMLAIEAVPSCSFPSEITNARSVHNRFIVNSRAMLSALPSMCAELMDKYHDEWLTDIILIIFHVIRGIDVKDMFKVWKTNSLLSKEEFQGSKELVRNDVAKHEEEIEHPKLHNGPNGMFGDSGVLALRPSSGAAVGGSLRAALAKERTARSATAGFDRVLSRNGRLGGVYTVKSSFQPSKNVLDVSEVGETQNGTSGGIEEVKLVVKDPFAVNGHSVASQAQRKRAKKNITFAKEDPYFDASTAIADDEGQLKACAVAATLIEKVCRAEALSVVVRRVNEDLRREEGRIGPDEETAYFRILCTIMQYYRFQIMEQKSNHERYLLAELASENNVDIVEFESRKKLWVPSLLNVIAALDRISFGRVLNSLNMLNNTLKRYRDVVEPMRVYKEMICFLRILLESGDPGHNEMAHAALYRLFYLSNQQDRQDPLKRLVSEWKPGVYSRKHTECLIELIHETLKTLDTAKSHFQCIAEDGAAEDAAVAAMDKGATKKKAKKDKIQRGSEMEQYFAAGLRFSVEDYFLRNLATSDAIELYTRLLAKYGTNDSTTNHYIACFLQRLCNFSLEQNHPARAPPSVGSSSNNSADEASDHKNLSLAFMLFNINTLRVFNTLLNDPNTIKDRRLQPIADIAKFVVLRFGEAARKNHMMFVETLLLRSAAHIHEFCAKLDNVYEATAYLHSNAGNSSKQTSWREDDDDDEEEGLARGERKNRSTATEKPPDRDIASAIADNAQSSDSEYGDEFDENDEAFAAVAPNSKSRRKPHRSAVSRKPKAARRDMIDSDEDSVSDHDVGSDDIPDRVRLQPARQKKRKSSWEFSGDSIDEAEVDADDSAELKSAPTRLVRRSKSKKRSRDPSESDGFAADAELGDSLSRPSAHNANADGANEDIWGDDSDVSSDRGGEQAARTDAIHDDIVSPLPLSIGDAPSAYGALEASAAVAVKKKKSSSSAHSSRRNRRSGGDTTTDASTGLDADDEDGGEDEEEYDDEDEDEDHNDDKNHTLAAAPVDWSETSSTTPATGARLPSALDLFDDADVDVSPLVARRGAAGALRLKRSRATKQQAKSLSDDDMFGSDAGVDGADGTALATSSRSAANKIELPPRHRQSMIDSDHEN